MLYKINKFFKKYQIPNKKINIYIFKKEKNKLINKIEKEITNIIVLGIHQINIWFFMKNE